MTAQVSRAQTTTAARSSQGMASGDAGVVAVRRGAVKDTRATVRMVTPSVSRDEARAGWGPDLDVTDDV